MLFRQLEYFVALARERHFARAASACFVSQPALSEAVRKLERELGVPLVRRGHSFHGLTPEGERVLLWARRILADHDSLRDEVTALQQGITGELRLGVVPAASTVAALLTDPFCAAHPLVRVSLETSLRSGDVVERVRDFELDAGIVYLGDDGGEDDGVRVRTLYRERQVLIAGDALVPEQGAPREWAEALGLPLCLLKPGMRGRQTLDAALTERGLSAAPRIETDSVATLLAHVATGRWASVVPEPWLAALPVPAGIRVHRLAGPPVGGRVALVASAAEPASVLTRAFFEVAGRVDRLREFSRD
ncbi:LysR family transcriptional regulator [Zhihengliuella sp.]|uniref:LysR family transcriptional regulator n=1 Tax=Zhihengliuella sp. TaxID=1954483 RepID=UPI0028125270|nr:LysR family transcriptional regulator [Zhihengliuella sp.]